jgi:hypothetical protein
MIKIDGANLLKWSVGITAFILVYVITDYQVAKHTGLKPYLNYYYTDPSDDPVR